MWVRKSEMVYCKVSRRVKDLYNIRYIDKLRYIEMMDGNDISLRSVLARGIYAP